MLIQRYSFSSTKKNDDVGYVEYAVFSSYDDVIDF